MNKDEQFDDDMDKLIQSAKQLIELCRQEDILDKIDKLIDYTSLTDAQAVIDYIKHNIKNS
jgi:hypothetical protein